MELKEIIDNKEQQKYMIHRTSISPLFINYDWKYNGQPILLSKSEFYNLSNAGNVYKLPIDFWQSDDEENSDIIKYLLENGITREIYLQKARANYIEQLNSFFNKGLYTQRTDITTTATEIDDSKNKTAEDKLEHLIKCKNIGFNAGETLLGRLSNREELNLIIVLEIPKDCLEADSTQMLFEQIHDKLEVDTAYFGLQTLDKIIPRQYIKCAIITTKNGFQVFDNPQYDSKYRVENGIYDDETLDAAIEKMQNMPYDYDSTIKIVEMIRNNYTHSGSYNEFKRRISKILDIVNKKIEIDSRNIILNDDLLLELEEARKKSLSSFRKACENLRNIDNMTENEATEAINTFLSLGTSFNESDPFYGLDIFNEGLSLLEGNALKKIYNNPNANDIIANIGVRKKLVEMFLTEKDINAEIISKSLDEETDKEKLLIEDRINDNRVHFILEAFKITDVQVVIQIINYINSNDLSTLTSEDCDNIIASFINNHNKSAKKK